MVAAFDLAGSQLAELLRDPSMADRNFASYPDQGRFFAIVYRFVSATGKVSGSATDRLSNVREYQFFNQELLRRNGTIFP